MRWITKQNISDYICMQEYALRVNSGVPRISCVSSLKHEWPIYNLSPSTGPTILLIRKLRRVVSVYFLVLVQDRFTYLRKKSNTRNLDRHLIAFSVIRDIAMAQHSLFFSRVTFAPNRPGFLKLLIKFADAHPFLQAILEDLQTFFSAGFIIKQHELSHKDFFHYFCV